MYNSDLEYEFTIFTKKQLTSVDIERGYAHAWVQSMLYTHTGRDYRNLLLFPMMKRGNP